MKHRESPPNRLAEYERKRTPGATNEPFGNARTGDARTLTGAFVVHLHGARHRHFDLRLEAFGVLASFAIPKGPSLDPADRRLAMRTEDHPLEYIDFEDVIPYGQYGAGPMIVWDRGAAEYLEGPAEDELAAGKMHFELHGFKLRGRFALINLGAGERPRRDKAARGEQWLLRKKADVHASTERNVVSELPASVLSGLTLEQLGNCMQRGEAASARALARGARAFRGARVDSLGVHPIAPDTVDRVAGGEWIYDAELQGLRVLAIRDGDAVTLRRDGESGEGGTIERFYPEIVRALRSLPTTRIALDGELVAFDASGHGSLTRLAKRVDAIASGDTRVTTTTPITLVVKDVLVVGEADVRSLPLSVRREILGEVIPMVGYLRPAPPLEGVRSAVLASCDSHGVAAVVAKPKGSLYGEGDPWALVATGLAPVSRVAVDHFPGPHAVARHVKVTNRTKVFWPEAGLTKGDLCDYYEAVSETLLPYLENRPVILVRYPDGIGGKSFFQWNVPVGMPSWIPTLEMQDLSGTTKRGFLVEDRATLIYIANLACIPLHMLGARLPTLGQADFFTIDFDVKQSGLRPATTLAKRLKEHLDAVELPGFVKTSGQSGLHVLVPLGPGQTFSTARVLADLFGRLLVEEFASIATMDRVIARRQDRVYIDTVQTGPSRAIVAPWSVRAVPGATISTPLRWDEVTCDLDPAAFTLKTALSRSAAAGDPMRGLLTNKPDISRVLARLTARIRPAT